MDGTHRARSVGRARPLSEPDGADAVYRDPPRPVGGSQLALTALAPVIGRTGSSRNVSTEGERSDDLSPSAWRRGRPSYGDRAGSGSVRVSIARGSRPAAMRCRI